MIESILVYDCFAKIIPRISPLMMGVKYHNIKNGLRDNQKN
jgi:hypothetical protein